MNIDDFVKILLALSISFAIVAVAFQFARLLGKFSKIVEDARKPLKNVTEVTDLALEDYKNVRKAVYSVKNVVSSGKEMFNFVKKLKKGRKQSQSTDEDEW